MCHSTSEKDRKEAEEKRRGTVEKLLTGLRKYRGRLHADFKFNREEANERR